MYLTDVHDKRFTLLSVYKLLQLWKFFPNFHSRQSPVGPDRTEQRRWRSRLHAADEPSELLTVRRETR